MLTLPILLVPFKTIVEGALMNYNSLHVLLSHSLHLQYHLQSLFQSLPQLIRDLGGAAVLQIVTRPVHVKGGAFLAAGEQAILRFAIPTVIAFCVRRDPVGIKQKQWPNATQWWIECKSVNFKGEKAVCPLYLLVGSLCAPPEPSGHWMCLTPSSVMSIGM